MRPMLRRTLICSCLMATCLLETRNPAGAEGTTNSAVDAIFADLTKPGSPGCALGIYRDGKIVYAKGYGLANVEGNVPITPQTVVDVRSISKQFTAASILLLEKQASCSSMMTSRSTSRSCRIIHTKARRSPFSNC